MNTRAELLAEMRHDINIAVESAWDLIRADPGDEVRAARDCPPDDDLLDAHARCG